MFSSSQFIEECVSGKYPPKIGYNISNEVPTYVIDLDLPATERWNQLGKDKGKEMENLLMTFKSLLLDFSNSSQVVIDLIDNDLGFLVSSMPQPFQDEMRGLSKSSELPLGMFYFLTGEVLLYNIFYEAFTVCTSIVAQDANGQLFHGRNLDFGLFLGWDTKLHAWKVTTALKPMIVNLDFQKAGKTIFKTVNFAGYIGALTGFKPGVFSLTMNERFNIDGGYIGIFKWLFGDRKSKWMSFLTRSTLENAGSYAEAKQALADTPMLAPAYFILGGNSSGQACIITRARDKAVDVWNVGERNHTWYLLQTNYDNWKKPLFIDDRRTPGNKCMQKLTQQVKYPSPLLPYCLSNTRSVPRQRLRACQFHIDYTPTPQTPPQNC
ncbi:hypothetical protein CAPTEDRAFT_173062 [Capitella teleta]|uniref:Acid ceramidase n=1 Tax=Capitella teleta TaxID=283909 RepID=R7TQC6_CAPTE|nr:hypothetical protein CAPTEDRAFT_173062 [Capitella teleta]|eukprot:ELT93716.1 hypothetical protein CAPTEDRAFT_173062 [Capitella teleta]